MSVLLAGGGRKRTGHEASTPGRRTRRSAHLSRRSLRHLVQTSVGVTKTQLQDLSGRPQYLDNGYGPLPELVG